MQERRSYRHLFFDLDRTLWDFEASSRLTFTSMIEQFGLASYGICDIGTFLPVYTEINEHLWDLYKQNRIRKEVLRSERFLRVLHHFGYDDPDLAVKLGDYYVYESPRRAMLFPGVHEVLGALQGPYSLHIITNGFEEVQQVKLDSAGLRKYFTKVITSEAAGVKKPEPGIFRFALEETGARLDESLMIGDDYEVDILGAKGAGMDQALVYCPQGNGCDATWCCPSLDDLLSFL